MTYFTTTTTIFNNAIEEYTFYNAAFFNTKSYSDNHLAAVPAIAYASSAIYRYYQ